MSIASEIAVFIADRVDDQPATMIGRKVAQRFPAATFADLQAGMALMWEQRDQQGRCAPRLRIV